MPKKSSPNIMHRFSGRDGRGRRIDALQSQILVAGNHAIATKLADHTTISYFNPGDELIIQGNSDNDIYFILSGLVSVEVNKREIATRRAGEHVGEIALIDTTALRSATNRILEPTVVARISEQEFTRIARKHPDLWRRIAVSLAQRLRERNKFQTVPRQKPSIFVGSSSEGLEIAGAIHNSLNRPFISLLWSQGVFECSQTTIEDLMRVTRETDFAIIVLTADDVTMSRGKKRPSPRDNVIFEMGLFMGALARERTFVIAPKGVDIKIPTDLMGVTCLEYQMARGKSITNNLQPVLRELRRLIKKYGPI